MEYHVNLSWDAEASVWMATSEDIPGLALEGGSLDALLERVRYAVPELLEMNGCKAATVLVFSTSERRERAVS